ncbi:LacI family transcriptional regulator [Paraburkholderia sp. CNPSo 3272]|uniref:LacI family DNA-binding transcriptional regulator n=1 Tax=Paraburkholderia sp. CNPSo 3272 TaxID=2940931 RepID=UPI0020B7BF75|nr:LacI family DNA-binding transcriptional regulator [Paraburkholderia sp. CNPSo 3272]MCP3724541.1 LacI family transcriptional regulator [Paraburkholderia sp. CNPSo 3272]
MNVPNRSLPTLREVAEAAGVSVGTASKVLSGSSDVSAHRAQSVREAAQRLGYRRNSLAADLRRSRPKSIGFVLPDLTNAFFVDLARLLENEALKNGYRLILAHADEDPERELERIRFVLSRQIAGMIVIPCRGFGQATNEIRAAGVPLVMADRVDETFPEHTITIDSYRAAYEGTQHLLALGHRRIAFLANTLELVNSKARADGYADAMREADLSQEVDVVRCGMTAEEIHVTTLRALHRSRRPTALFAGGNVTTLGALRAMRDADLRIPEDLSLLSFDDAPWMSVLRPCLTTIRQPVEDIGHSIWQLMWALINDEQRDTVHLKLKAELQVRESTAPPAHSSAPPGSTVV